MKFQWSWKPSKEIRRKILTWRSTRRGGLAHKPLTSSHFLSPLRNLIRRKTMQGFRLHNRHNLSRLASAYQRTPSYSSQIKGNHKNLISHYNLSFFGVKLTSIWLQEGNVLMRIAKFNNLSSKHERMVPPLNWMYGAPSARTRCNLLSHPLKENAAFLPQHGSSFSVAARSYSSRIR